MRNLWAVVAAVIAGAGTAPVLAAASGPATPTPASSCGSVTSSVSPSSAVSGAGAVTFAYSATQVNGFGPLSGTVTVTDQVDSGAVTTVGTFAVGSATNTSGRLSASWTYVLGAAGVHHLTFALVTNCAGSSATAAAITIVAVAGPTSSRNPSTAGQAVTFTVRVIWGSGTVPWPSAPSVTFYDGSAVLGSTTMQGNGYAQLTTAALVAGAHAIRASVPDGSGTPVTSSVLSQTIVVPATPTPSPIATQPPAATGTPQPSAAAVPPPTPTPTATPTPAVVASAGGPPPGTLAGTSLTGADVPLVGAYRVGTVPAGVYDRAMVPAIEPLGPLGGISFGAALEIWPLLLAIIVASIAGIEVTRRRWAAADDADDIGPVVANASDARGVPAV